MARKKSSTTGASNTTGASTQERHCAACGHPERDQPLVPSKFNSGNLVHQAGTHGPTGDWRMPAERDN